MELYCFDKRYWIMIFSLLFYNGVATCALVPEKPHVYLGLLGGYGSAYTADMNQYGTAYLTEANGGPLAVDAIGNSITRDFGFIGGHLGYLGRPFSIKNQILTPAIELEGLYFTKSTITGNDITNATSRLAEHDFSDTLPMKAGVLLTNFVVNFESITKVKFIPYLGVGIGGAALSVNGADSYQSNPAEAGINHFNSNPNDATATVAAQIKAGFNYQINEGLQAFAEYRWLSIYDAEFFFGSTRYSTHVETSQWTVDMGKQSFNLFSAGMRFIT
jgi:hypothetical protein